MSTTISSPHAVLRDPFHPVHGAFRRGLRDLDEWPPNRTAPMWELVNSMKGFGWIPEFPAFMDERGVVLVGNRRMRIARDLGIEPVVSHLVFGTGDAADARRFRLALCSNIGHKPLAPKDQRRISEYLYGDSLWLVTRIAEALKTAEAQS